ncbi:MAG: LicD family protein [Lachnospiraceae bacterium]|nr:LicD family protein [Lachnospiraceae bacterium]
MKKENNSYTDIDELHKIQLKLLKRLDYICSKHNITYYLNGGTLLGAVRNGDFIPWDDDVDVSMFREEFDKFVLAMEKEKDERYFFQKPNGTEEICLWGFARIRDNNTTQAWAYELAEGPENTSYGIWIDIQIFDNVYKNSLKRRIQLFHLRYWQKIKLAKSYLKKYDRFWCLNKIKWSFYKRRAKKYTTNYIDKKILFYSKNCKEDELVASLALHKKIRETKCIKKDCFKEGERISFNNLKLNVPKKYNEVLTKLYGKDYMIPPLEKNSGHGDLIIDTNRSFKRYINYYRKENWKKNCENKIIIIFGSGQQAEYFICNEEKKYMPKYIVDNNKEKWDKSLKGIEIKNPEILNKMDKNKIRVIIANIYWEQISLQLEQMGVYDYYSYINENAWKMNGGQK